MFGIDCTYETMLRLSEVRSVRLAIISASEVKPSFLITMLIKKKGIFS